MPGDLLMINIIETFKDVKDFNNKNNWATPELKKVKQYELIIRKLIAVYGNLYIWIINLKISND